MQIGVNQTKGSRNVEVIIIIIERFIDSENDGRIYASSLNNKTNKYFQK